MRNPNGITTVTQVLAPFSGYSSVGSSGKNMPGVLAVAASRGTTVHRACAAISSGAFLPEEIPEDCKGYIESFRKWFELMVDGVIFVEREFMCWNFGYMGHPDLGVFLKGGEKALIDLKTPISKRSVWAAQLAAYKWATESELGFKWDRIGSLQLSPDGEMAKVEWYRESARDMNAFLAALTATRYFL
jgi:hypothetical protein